MLPLPVCLPSRTTLPFLKEEIVSLVLLLSFCTNKKIACGISGRGTMTLHAMLVALQEVGCGDQ